MPRTPAPLCITVVVFVYAVCTCEAATGLRGGSLARQELESLLSQIESSLGRRNTRERVARFEAQLGPVYAALPKNMEGRLAQPTVRYALHRLFGKHGMLVAGLDSRGRSWNESSTPTAILSENVPSFVESMLEERLADHGFGLHDLAIFAFALKHLFQTESAVRLEAAYNFVGIPVEGTLEDARVYEVIDVYLMIFLLERDLKDTTWLRKAQHQIERLYPGWPAARMWAHDTRRSIAFAERDRTNPFVSHEFDFSDVLRIVEELHEQYGVSQDAECKELKDFLLEHEFGNTGRVRLADFHGSALRGKWQLSEAKSYLRQIGVLDESSPEDPRVVVPNYMYAISNCVAKSGYYEVCCINECDSIMEHLERSLAKPEASPQEVAGIVAHLSSSTVPAPRNLSQVLLERLEAVASANGGVCPLHSRLFAQWLHHAYPRECPYPHIAGTTRSMTGREWLKETGEQHVASRAEMRQHAQNASWNAQGAEAAARALLHEDEQLLPWSGEEELLYPSQGPVAAKRGATWFKWLIPLSGIFASACSLARTAWSARSSMDSPTLKYYV